jgi:glycosyltransferase involved in cell wall biosynthesis
MSHEAPEAGLRGDRERWPLLTVVVPVRNEGPFIGSTLEQILAQNYPKERLEILVVDGGSTDSTKQKVSCIAGSHAQIRLLENPKRLSSAARNIGFQSGKGDIFVVIDGHCYLQNEHLFRNIVECFDRSKADCLGRPQPLNPPGLTRFQEAIAIARASPLGHSRTSYIYSNREGYWSPVSVGAMYKRKVFETIGYVDESFDACEDVEFNYRVEKAGLCSYFHPSLGVCYYPRPTLLELLKQMYRYGKGRAKLAWKHPDLVHYEAVILILLILGIPLLLLLGLWSTLFLFLFCIVYGVYIGVILATSTCLALRTRVSHLVYLPVIFMTIHFGVAAGFLANTVKCLFFSSTELGTNSPICLSPGDRLRAGGLES